MDSAVYGLLGAVGGAGVTACVAYLGPLRLYRLQAADRQASEVRQDVAHREAARDAEMAQDLERIVRLRVTTGLWVSAMERFLHDLQLGRKVDIHAFDQELSTLEERVRFVVSEWSHSKVYMTVRWCDLGVDVVRRVRAGFLGRPCPVKRLRQDLDEIDRHRGEIIDTCLELIQTRWGAEIIRINS